MTSNGDHHHSLSTTTTSHTVQRLRYDYLRDLTAVQIEDYVKDLERYGETLDDPPTVLFEVIFTLRLMYEAKLSMRALPEMEDPVENEQNILVS